MEQENIHTPPSPGGFLPPTPAPPSPAPSSPSRAAAALPHPRARPLRPGSNKEELTRRHVEAQLLHVSRRYVKKFQPAELRDGGGGVRGYSGMAEVCRDLGEVVDVLWRSGTREFFSPLLDFVFCFWGGARGADVLAVASLQIPYLFNIAVATSSYLPAFAAAPGPTFALLRKLDHAFASLLERRDVESGEGLPGLEEGGGMSRTEMVRCKSLVEQTRVVVVEVMGRERGEEEEEGEGEDGYEDASRDGMDGEGDGDGDAEMGWDDDEDEDEMLHMDVATVYEKTIVRLNEALHRGTAYDVGSSG